MELKAWVVVNMLDEFLVADIQLMLQEHKGKLSRIIKVPFAATSIFTSRQTGPKLL